MDVRTPVQAIGLVQDFLLDRPVETPDDVREQLKAIIAPGANPTPIAVREVAELIFARRAELAPELIEIGLHCANMLIFYQQFNYHNERGVDIVTAFNGGETELEPLDRFDPAPEPEPIGPLPPRPPLGTYSAD